jgi:cytoskeletal protein CcmA (bactofilin family)
MGKRSVQKGIVQKEKTSIDNLVFIVGDIKAEKDLIINGTVKGNVEIKNHSFFLGPSGRLQGKIDGLDVRIRGQMKGEIKATGKVEITQDAKFEGKIKCKTISVEEGGYFNADVDLGRKSPEKESLKETSMVAEGSESS